LGKSEDEIGQLVNRLEEDFKVPKTVWFKEPVVLQEFAVPGQNSEKMLDVLTDSMKQLSIGITTMVQSGAVMQLPQDVQNRERRDAAVQSASIPYLGVTSESGLGHERPSPGALAFAKSFIVPGFTVSKEDQDRGTKGICPYCYNRNTDYPQHSFRNQYPLYEYHLAMGTTHLNSANRLCLGPEREGIREITLTRGIP
jgi:hypothetical protein